MLRSAIGQLHRKSIQIGSARNRCSFSHNTYGLRLLCSGSGNGGTGNPPQNGSGTTGQNGSEIPPPPGSGQNGSEIPPARESFVGFRDGKWIAGSLNGSGPSIEFVGFTNGRWVGHGHGKDKVGTSEKADSALDETATPAEKADSVLDQTTAPAKKTADGISEKKVTAEESGAAAAFSVKKEIIKVLGKNLSKVVSYIPPRYYVRVMNAVRSIFGASSISEEQATKEFATIATNETYDVLKSWLKAFMNFIWNSVVIFAGGLLSPVVFDKDNFFTVWLKSRKQQELTPSDLKSMMEKDREAGVEEIAKVKMDLNNQIDVFRKDVDEIKKRDREEVNSKEVQLVFEAKVTKEIGQMKKSVAEDIGLIGDEIKKRDREEENSKQVQLQFQAKVNKEIGQMKKSVAETQDDIGVIGEKLVGMQRQLQNLKKILSNPSAFFSNMLRYRP